MASRHRSTQASLATETASLVAKAPGWFDCLLSRRAEPFLLYNLSWMCSTPSYHDNTVGGTDDVGRLAVTPEAQHGYEDQRAAMKVIALPCREWCVCVHAAGETPYTTCVCNEKRVRTV